MTPPPQRLVAALDLGSTKVVAVIAEITGDAREPGAKILGLGVERSGGIRRGVVRDIEEMGEREQLVILKKAGGANERQKATLCPKSQDAENVEIDGHEQRPGDRQRQAHRENGKGRSGHSSPATWTKLSSLHAKAGEQCQ